MMSSNRSPQRPQDVRCPRCGARKGQPCITRGGEIREGIGKKYAPHIQRVLAFSEQVRSKAEA